MTFESARRLNVKIKHFWNNTKISAEIREIDHQNSKNKWKKWLLQVLPLMRFELEESIVSWYGSSRLVFNKQQPYSVRYNTSSITQTVKLTAPSFPTSHDEVWQNGRVAIMTTSTFTMFTFWWNSFKLNYFPYLKLPNNDDLINLQMSRQSIIFISHIIIRDTSFKQGSR